MKTAYQSEQIMMMPERMRPNTMRTRMAIRTVAANQGVDISANALRYFSQESLEAALSVIRAGEAIRFVFATRDRAAGAASVTIPGGTDAHKTP